MTTNATDWYITGDASTTQITQQLFIRPPAVRPKDADSFWPINKKEFELICDKLAKDDIIDFVNGDKKKIIYSAIERRDFNRYINASDLLEEFIYYMGKCGIRQS